MTVKFILFFCVIYFLIAGNYSNLIFMIVISKMTKIAVNGIRTHARTIQRLRAVL